MTGARDVLRRLFAAAVEAVAPETLVTRTISISANALELRRSDGTRSVLPRPVCVLGAGKAAGRMAAGVERAGGYALPGTVLVPDGCAVSLRNVACSVGGHPLPDERGCRATERILAAASKVAPGESALVLLSGGASSLLVQPAPPLSLADKIAVNRLLLESGAAIAEVNAVRKHLSLSKGGGLARACRGQTIALIISDVIGDDPAVVASGPTAPDASTFADALDVAKRHGFLERLPAPARARLDAGARGDLPETLKADDPESARVLNVVIGSNAIALDAAAEAARNLGFDVKRVQPPIDGDTAIAAGRFSALLLESETTRASGRPLCVLAGGETTVRVTGPGKGGRNQEFALALTESVAGHDITVLSAGSDGVDGPTEAAGAFVDGTTLGRARTRGLEPGAFLTANDSYSFFQGLGDLFSPGPTATNVMDLKIAVIGGLPDANRRLC